MEGKNSSLTTVVIICFLTFACLPSQAASSAAWYESFINRIASTVYTAAWPTATYHSVELADISQQNNGSDIAVRLYGRSGLDNSLLWTDVVISIRNGSVSGLSWGRNNALVMQPGVTATLLAGLMAKMTQELQTSTSVQERPISQSKASVVLEVVDYNKHGAILKLDQKILYLGKSCDVVSPKLGDGRWGLSDGKVLVVVGANKYQMSLDAVKIRGCTY